MQKSQVSVFIIFGLVIIVIIGVIYYQGSTSNKPVQKAIGIDAFNIYITGCMNIAGKEAAIETARNSFNNETIPAEYYYTTLNRSLTDSFAVNRSDISYFAYEKNNLLPTTDKIQKSYTDIFKSRLKSCLVGLTEFSARGYIYNISEPTISVTFNDTINIDANIEGNVHYETTSYSLEKYHATIDYPYISKYNIISGYISRQAQSDYLELGYLTNIAYEQGFIYEAYYTGDKSTVIKMIFNDSKDSLGEELIVPFAVKTTK